MLAACGGTSGDSTADRGQVASLDRSRAASASAPDAQAGRPRLRLDASDEEKKQIWVNYAKCLREHGATELDAGTGTEAGPVGADNTLTSNREATAACVTKQPLPAVELDPAANPNFAAQWNDYVKCERKGGVMMHVTEPGQEAADPGAENIDADQWLRVTAACQKEVFGG